MKKTSKQDVYELYLDNYIPKYGIAAVISLQHSEEIRGWFASNVTEILVEAEYVSTFKKWKPVRQVVNVPISSFNDVC